MTGPLLTAGFVLALFLLGAAAVAVPGSLLRYRYVPLALGLTEGARRAVTRAAGAALVLLSLWLAWRFYAGAA
jgi:hypothetical protein